MQQYIGIDVGGTHVKYGVINSDGEELTHHQFDTPEDASTFTRKWQDVVARCQQDYDIAAIGVSFPGHINPHNGHAAKAGALAGTVAKLAMRQPFVLFKGLTFQKLCLPGAFRPGDHHNKMLRPGLCVVHASPQYL